MLALTGNGGREQRALYSPTGYRLDEGTDRGFLIHLKRPDGSVVASYDPGAVDLPAVEARTWKDRRE